SRFVSAGTELFLSRWSRVDHDGFSFDVAKESDSNLNDMWLYCFDLDSTNNARDLTYESLKKVLGQKNIELALPEPVEY
ncbi:MAG: hypothetical protein KDD25_10125, partial [Bdellovibrionales bacterium]|nr:hypothetical protein [Bdellovibrionales bacterium]